MVIERFVWTAHAEFRREQRRLDRSAIEQAIRDGHANRQTNDGRAEWLMRGRTADGVPFEAIYDHPHGGDQGAVRIVSVWRLER
jgi:Domain of unknown function (DUF4258)